MNCRNVFIWLCAMWLTVLLCWIGKDLYELRQDIRDIRLDICHVADSVDVSVNCDET